MSGKKALDTAPGAAGRRPHHGSSIPPTTETCCADCPRCQTVATIDTVKPNTHRRRSNCRVESRRRCVLGIKPANVSDIAQQLQFSSSSFVYERRVCSLFCPFCARLHSGVVALSCRHRLMRWGGRGTRASAPNFERKVMYFSGKCHVKIGYFVNFSYIYFRAKMSCPLKVD